MSIAFKDWNIQEMTGYEPITTFYMDFSIADRFGVTAVNGTYKRAFSHWKGNYKYLTELVMALNWKIWEHYEKNAALAQVYSALWEAASEWATSHLKGDELAYYYRTTD